MEKITEVTPWHPVFNFNLISNITFGMIMVD
ncbi:unnamed protein product, partial [marine sediment metagenome]